MKGLLYKDFCSLGQMKFYFVLILAFACIPDENLPRFAMVYAAMLPITALAYDEKSRWDSFAASLPCSKTSIVLSKYFLGLLSLSAIILLSVAARFVYSLFGIMDFSVDFLGTTFLSFLTSVLIQSILLPIMFKFGVEKGRLFFMIATVGVVLGSISLIDAVGASIFSDTKSSLVLLVAFAVVAVVFAVSVFISSKVYKYSR